MRDEDLKIDTYALGPAHGFDTSRANMVRVTHKPTGISVERGTERSQYANRCAAQGALARLVGFSSGSILPPPDFALDGGSQPCYYAETVQRIVAALSAQQSAHVSVPRELLERAMYAKDGRELIEANRELRALLNGGEA